MSKGKCLGFLVGYTRTLQTNLPIINFFRVFISCVCAKLTSRLGASKLLDSGLNWERILTKRDKNLLRAWKQTSTAGKIKTGSPFETTRAQRFVFSRASSNINDYMSFYLFLLFFSKIVVVQLQFEFLDQPEDIS